MKEERQNNFNWKDKTILLVNTQDENYYYLLKDILEKTEAKMILETDCKNSVEFCKKNKLINMVFIDIDIQEINGLESLRQICEYNNELLIIGIVDRSYISDFKNTELKKFISKIETMFSGK